MVLDDLDKICLLIRESDNEVHQEARLTVGIYTLSHGSVEASRELTPVFNYKFEEASYVVMADSALEDDLNSLYELGYVNQQRRKLKNERTDHEHFILLERGVKAAENAELNLQRPQIESIKKIGKELGDSNITAGELLEKYGAVWCIRTIEEFGTPT